MIFFERQTSELKCQRVRNFAQAIRLLVLACVSAYAFISPISLCADEVELKTSVDRRKVQIADPFHFEVRLLAPQGTVVSFPALAESFGPFEILEVTKRSDVPVFESGDGQRLWIRDLTLETLDTGALQIPSIEVTVSQPGQPNRVLRTEPINVIVESVVEPSSDLTQFQDIADLRDVERVPVNSNWWVWLATGVVTLAVVAGGIVFLTTRRQGEVSSSTWALQQLDTTRDLPVAESVVRQYIEERFGVAAMSLPDAKIVEELRVRQIDETTLRDLHQLLQKSEKVKFSGMSLPITEESRFINLAIKLIRRFDALSDEVVQ